MTLSPPPRRPDPPLPHTSVQEFFLDPSLDLVSVRASTMASRAVLLEASESNVEEETDRKSETETESKSSPEVCLVLGLGSSSGEGNPSMTVRVVSLMGNAGSTPPFPPQTRECQRPRVLPPPYHDHVHRRPRGWGRCVPSRMRFRHTFARRFQSDPERRCPRPRLQLGGGARLALYFYIPIDTNVDIPYTKAGRPKATMTEHPRVRPQTPRPCGCASWDLDAPGHHLAVVAQRASGRSLRPAGIGKSRTSKG